ncbi:MAG: energy transducer TonB [Hyphomicrobiales bacterium]|nr:energy transducer TonB [Hyphomicrobiales bacterium]
MIALQPIGATGSGRLGSMTRWSLAAACVGALHAGAVWAALALAPPAPPAGAPDATIMLELEPISLPADPSPEALAPGPEVQEAEAEPPPEPESETAAPEPAPAETAALPDMPDAEAVLPPPARETPREAEPKPRLQKAEPKPKPKPKPRPEPRAVTRPERKVVAQRPSAPARAARAGETSQATVGSSLVSPAARSSWQSQVVAHLNRNKRSLPNGATGAARVAFRLGQGGQVLSASVAGSSGDPVLDQEALALVRRASPMPPPPPGMGGVIALAVPIRFTR